MAGWPSRWTLAHILVQFKAALQTMLSKEALQKESGDLNEDENDDDPDKLTAPQLIVPIRHAVASMRRR